MFDRITVTTPAGAGALKFWKLSGVEQVSHSFELQVMLLSTDARLDRRAMLGQPITLTIPTQGLLSAPRYLNGKVTSVNVHSADINGARYAVYTLTMESDLWPLKRDRNQRIFQNQRVPDIVRTVLGEYGVQMEEQLSGSYRSWEYCVQYQESSYDFISRLMELEGIYFFFRHEADKHTLVLHDAPQQHQPFSGYEAIPYHATPSGGSTGEEGIGQWAISERVTPGIYSIDDYDFRKPNAWLFQARQNPSSPQPGQIDYYDWPGHFVEHGDGEFYARVRQEEWQAEHQRISATATALGIVPGCTFTLLNPPFVSDSGEYLVLSASYDLEENSYASGGDEAVHRIDMTVIPADTPYRSPQRTPWPRTHGPQTARVVGPQGESIWTDKYGRIKVKFHWDRQAKGDETSSGWVRVSSAWAGQGFGGVQIPRVGDEVVIDFINGDPDRPIVTGRVYNEASMPPWALPAGATMMGFMTRSKDGHSDNSSHLFFEDKAGSEMVQLHAEKDMNISVENDKTVTVDGNRTTTIQKKQQDEVFGDARFTYHGTRTTTVTKKETKTFEDGEKVTISNGRNSEITSGGEQLKITGERRVETVGTEEQIVSKKVTRRYNEGMDFYLEGKRYDQITGKRHVIVTDDVTDDYQGNLNQTITKNVDTKILGNWKQDAKEGMTLTSDQMITIDSKVKVSIKTPAALEYKDHKETVSMFSFDFTAAKVVTEGYSTTVTVGGKLGLATMKFDKTGFDLSTKEGRVEFGQAMVQVGQIMSQFNGLTIMG
ncbi:TPA: type VI secretion system tip protein VgrG [Serratia rubidaea]|uniref:type VI secretion system Vgr family protein n=1 Tax=Serratia rubidaea TaxID=61652 RepID=UPI0023AFF413|nr:type VI secretion system tip protein TssI/VgrG [Serratia rubidaea]MDK1705422.1 type VI secretion system tip protein TssI/VgrG [Serratia rubidaea]HDJ1438660.1 type VI secretion system tip protein VgrG [Serratia rubidaea]HDJ1448801.1 type VI secretion system tip protein VgrG [Serratia rubidaea]HDJ1462193.1 type VI secretion system tip protein VgrG [Serratia rubidaea]HDJ2771455.1 type VI secretion system tip protein VgrG [Serratia rubidaea]